VQGWPRPALRSRAGSRGRVARAAASVPASGSLPVSAMRRHGLLLCRGQSRRRDDRRSATSGRRPIRRYVSRYWREEQVTRWPAALDPVSGGDAIPSACDSGRRGSLGRLGRWRTPTRHARRRRRSSSQWGSGPALLLVVLLTSLDRARRRAATSGTSDGLARRALFASQGKITRTPSPCTESLSGRVRAMWLCSLSGNPWRGGQ
jgi:hypothetical protein